MRAALLLPLLAGCAPALDGWWNVVRLSAERDGARDVREDAGFALFSEDGDLTFGLSYDYDAVTATWLPDPDPEIAAYASDYERTPEGEPDLSMYFLAGADDEQTFYLELDVLDQRSSAMVLESLSTPDGAVLRFELER